MIYPDWREYASYLYASSWWQLFTNGDPRSTLTWSNRLGNLGNVDIYNFYSSGEEVLREDTNGAPPSEVSVSTDQLDYWLANVFTDNALPVGSYVWQWQEMLKGRGIADSWIGSSHGGWSFNTIYYTGDDPVHGVHLSPPTDVSELQTNAFFDFSSLYMNDISQLSTQNSDDWQLYTSSGDSYARANRNRILSDAIQALTQAIGANPVPALQSIGRNVNMSTANFENGWPVGRLSNAVETNNWHHSDFDYVAYPYTHRLFDAIVINGNLK
ncbi:MAG TPA: hypothetical protein VFB72_02825 [Verrucomicrobiae bacterium]|nr:hypothetical protein [Verrucomicrobiae bacterium]